MKIDIFRDRFIHLLILSPYIYLLLFISINNNGDKYMVIFSIISIIATLVFSKNRNLKDNIKNPVFISISLMSIYILLKYTFMSASPSMLRVFLSVTLLMMVFPFHLITEKRIILLSFFSSILISINTSYYSFYLGHSRNTGLLNAIPYSTICSVIALIGLFYFLKTWRKIPLITFILSTGCVILSQTRGLWLALLCSVAILIFYSIKNNKSWLRIILVISLTALSLSYLMKDTIQTRIHQTQIEIEKIESGDLSSSIGLRVQMWKAAIEISKVNPWFGVGAEHKQTLSNLVEKGTLQKSIGEFHPDHYHNQFFENLAKMGIIGLILTILLIITPIIHAIKIRTMESGLIISLSTLFFIACLTDVPFWYAETALVYLLLITPLCSKNHQLLEK
ncbi:O-antigen ligase family protein [Vibrio cincinnatiensis]|uniref:O-antigen ligase family protein n=1 Tax=Vibrio cincinnatiensis TaxID=675 RepID=UPI001EE07865|nr:O-antigen ligase family protein [Vibrio cincinnatiensis]MCG3722814.1 O-antigen ligase family protein [Vibrio cincinnatiensis]